MQAYLYCNSGHYFARGAHCKWSGWTHAEYPRLLARVQHVDLAAPNGPANYELLARASVTEAQFLSLLVVPDSVDDDAWPCTHGTREQLELVIERNRWLVERFPQGDLARVLGRDARGHERWARRHLCLSGEPPIVRAGE